MRGDSHVRFGERPGETDPQQCGHRAPGRLNCDRPAAWCRAHHLKHWIHDGETNLNDLALVCDFCLDLVHHQGWDARMGPHGYIEFIPPAWLDIEQKPIVNTYHRAVTLFHPRN
jgi:hypothetical protein